MSKWTQTRECPNCVRVFFVLIEGLSGLVKEGCPAHCTAPCCRAAGCSEAKPSVRSVRSTRTCSVCHRPRWMFEPFAPCSDQCTLMRYRSTRKQVCMIHRPTAKPRIHIDYCSLEHFNDWEKGHLERTRAGRRVRWRRHSDEYLSQARFRREKARC